MGYYINPPNETKEEFLQREGTKFSPIEWKNVPDDSLPVVLINNGFFTAAGIAYSKRELEAFIVPADRRPKSFYLVKIEKLLPVSDLVVERIQR